MTEESTAPSPTPPLSAGDLVPVTPISNKSDSDTARSSRLSAELGLYILDESGAPIPEPDTYKWAEWMTDARRRVKSTHIEGPPVTLISTAFLGLNHRFGDGPPLLYETMVFQAPTGALDKFCARYETKEQAIAGHNAVQEHLLSAGLDITEEMSDILYVKVEAAVEAEKGHTA